MSKGFRVTTNRDGSRNYNQNFNRNKGTFKPPNKGGGMSFSARKIQQYLEGDVNMDEQADGLHHTNRGRGRHRGMRGGRQLHIPISKTDWYRVTIPYAKELTEDFILKSINSSLSIPFLPVNFRKESTFATFYIKGHKEALAIKSLNKTISTPAGFKMFISLATSEVPQTPLNEATLSVIKQVMSKRYNELSQSLDLSDLMNDPDIKVQNINLIMNRPKVLTSILQIVSQNIPMLTSLNISNNKLTYLDPFSEQCDKLPSLTSFDLSYNKLSNEAELRHVSKLKLTSLNLSNNPLCKLFKQKHAYIRAIRNKFPELLMLDGASLPPIIKFNIDNDAQLPPAKESFFGDGSMREVIGRFLQQYFGVYDSEDRSMLIGAYHPQATLSLTCLQSRSHGSNHFSGMHEYLRFNRNLKRIHDAGERADKVQRGGESVVVMLKKLPSTLHLLDTFVVDLQLTAPAMMIISVQGIFIETQSNLQRHFNKLLVAVPNAEGLAIMNEMTTITNLSPDLVQKYKHLTVDSIKKKQQQAAEPQQVAASSLNTQQTEMVAMFSQQSGMNSHYSFMCLSGNDWNFQQAAAKFAELKASNSIPPEAYSL